MQHIFTGSGAPNFAPQKVGHHYIDTLNKVNYIAVGTDSAADWQASEVGQAITDHEALPDPHPQYLTQAEASALYEPVGVTITTVKYVSQQGDDTTGTGDESRPYRTIKKALSTITDASSTKPYTVRVMPGIYTEDNSTGPIAIPNRVALIGEDKYAAVIKFNTSGNVGLTMGFHVSIDGFQIAGGSAAAISSVNKTKWGLFNINFSSGAKLLSVSGGSNDIFLENIFAGPATTGLFEFTNNCFVRLKNIESEGTGTAFSIAGASTRANIELCRVSGATTAFDLSSGATMDFTAVRVTNSTTGVQLNGGSKLQGNDIDLNENVTNQILQQDTLSSIQVTTAVANEDNIQIINWDTVRLTYQNVKTGQTVIANGMNVGIPEKGQESQFGEGGEYTRGMKVYTYDGATFVDRTADVLTEGGNTVTIPNVNTNSGLYIGSNLKKADGTPVKFWGLDLYKTQPAVLGAGSLVYEYWNGSAWATLNHMDYLQDGTYRPLARQGLVTAGTHAVSFDDRLYTRWQLNDPVGLGETRYWVRIRIASTITTAPVLDRVELMSSHTNNSIDGFQTFHGTARPIKKLDLAFGSFQASIDSPADQDVLLSDFLDIGRVENLFQNNALDRTGATFQLPLDIDTSCPIRLRITYFNSTNTGNTLWRVRWGLSNTGDTIYTGAAGAPTTAPGEQVITRNTTVPAVADTQTAEVFELEIPEAVAEKAASQAGGLIWLTLERDGSADTNAGALTLIDFIPYYTAWRNGGHIANWT